MTRGRRLTKARAALLRAAVALEHPVCVRDAVAWTALAVCHLSHLPGVSDAADHWIGLFGARPPTPER